MLINATDGLPAVLVDGVLHIMQAFAEHGPPAKRVADWTGRWWSLGGVTDLVPMGSRVFVALPQENNPLAAAAEIRVGRGDQGRIVNDGGFGNHGEAARLVRSRSNEVREVWFGGTRLLREPAAAREARKRYIHG
jgi:hypothetical protein